MKNVTSKGKEEHPGGNPPECTALAVSLVAGAGTAVAVIPLARIAAGLAMTLDGAADLIRFHTTAIFLHRYFAFGFRR